MLTIVNGLVRRALLRSSCLGLIFREESGFIQPKYARLLTYVACHFSRAKRAPPKAEKGHTMKEIGNFRGTHILRPYYPIIPNMELID